MEDEVYAACRLVDAVVAANVAQMEADSSILDSVAHIILFFLITAEDPDLLKPGLACHVDHGVAKCPCAARDEKLFAFEHVCMRLLCHASSIVKKSAVKPSCTREP